MPSFLSHKSRITAHLQKVIIEQQQFWHSHTWAGPLLSELAVFAQRGKMVRGSVLLESWKMYAQPKADEVFPEEVLTGAVIIELLESALLMHDDIIDRDELRRGVPSFHKDMAKFFTGSAEDQQHGGVSIALLTGDITFFIVFSIMGHLPLPADTRTAVITCVSDNLLATGFGQTIDTVAGLNRTSLNESEIEDIHRYKTGRYSFSLPLEAGALLGGVTNRQELTRLRQLGETLGLIYQTVDDSLSIFGQDKSIGKKVGNDIREAKQTLFVYHAMKLANKQQKLRLETLYGKHDISDQEIEEVRSLIKETGALGAVTEYLDEQEKSALKEIDKLSAVNKEFLAQLLQVLRHRQQ